MENSPGDPALRLGCQTFTWEMLGEAWTGGPDDYVAAIAAAGYAGIEISDNMIGDYAGRPADLARRLSDAGLTLVGFAAGAPSGYTEAGQVAGDLDRTRRWLEFLGHFPGAVLSMGSATVVSPGERAAKFAVAAEVYNHAAALGRAEGVPVAVHPSSHHGTLLFDRADYDALFARLEPGVGWVPDTGHILRGGMAPSEVLAAHRARIRYLHLKDVDEAGAWAMLGEGVCDIPGVVAAVRAAPGFNGWIVAEEEAAAARADPAAAVRTDFETLGDLGLTAGPDRAQGRAG